MTRYFRQFSFAVFALAMLMGSGTVVKADYHECIELGGYRGFVYYGEEVECSDPIQTYCQAFCDLCFGSECYYLNSCEPHSAVSGACQ